MTKVSADTVAAPASALSFIESQFPVSKVSKESYKERKANYSQTLTGLGKWWGRKPLILVRAAILGVLMPASSNPAKDREVFLRLLTMDEEGLWRRKSKSIPLKICAERLTRSEHDTWFDGTRLRKGARSKSQELQRLVFSRFSYDEKLEYCDRPEHLDGPSEESWKVINAHLKTSAKNLPELVKELGERQFGRTPRVGDSFCGGGSIPFEAARIGCEAYGSDLNPVGALLTWAALNIVGGGPEVAAQVRKAQQEVYEAVDRQITEWGIEHNELGWRADAYLYCVEVRCPECGWMVPMAPSWAIGEKTHTIARLKPNRERKEFDIEISSDVSEQELEEAKSSGTAKDSELHCPNCPQNPTPIAALRGDRQGPDGRISGLRLWEDSDVVPRPSDVFQERLYCIRWVETYTDSNGDIATRRYYRAPDESDRSREQKVFDLLTERFDQWQRDGLIPKRGIESGYNTDQPMRERGWTYWHHLFAPRQLLISGTIFNAIQRSKLSVVGKVGCLLGAGRCVDYNARLSRWHPHGANEKSEQVFSNQALNTLSNFGVRTTASLKTAFNLDLSDQILIATSAHVEPIDCRKIVEECDLWVTDPPYADAVNYHELSEFFLAWYEGFLRHLFPDWYSDSRRALAVTGSDQNFRRSMVDCYSTLAQHMPENGIQIVMFTHQDASVWADLALILWAAGLRVTAAWCIATETDTSFREGNYVQGTVLLVLRKQTATETPFLDEVVPRVEDEVRAQLDSMIALDDQDDPNFGDTDYQLAAYAAALRVLTRYKSIEDIDVAYELSRTRTTGERSKVELLIADAVKTACDHLIPRGFDSFVWKTLTPEERFFLEGLELESHKEFRSSAYMELARGFGIRDYRSFLSSGRANQTRLKTATEFGNGMMNDSGFGASLVRHALFGIREVTSKNDTQEARNFLFHEVPNYWGQRKSLIAILRYLATMELHSPNWKEDGHSAALLAGAIEND
jgi:adenine-specific DNA methylase